jgi:predicted lipoprotein with Yx(FWY)xxD motif
LAAFATKGAAVGIVLSSALISPSGATSSHSLLNVEVTTKKSSSLGTYLVSNGRTLYTLNKTSCPSTCLKYWPPLVLAKGQSVAMSGSGVSASKLGRIKDAKGAWQVTYAGKALFWFAKDTTSDPLKGNQVKDTWGLWSIDVTKKPTHTGAGSTTTTTTTTVPSGGGTSF